MRIILLLLTALPLYGQGLLLNPYSFGSSFPITLVQNKGNQATASGTTVAVTPDNAVAAGDAIIVYVDGAGDWATGSPTVSVSDSVNGAYTLVRGRQDASASIKGTVFYFASSAAGTPTITATFSTSFTDKSIVMYQYHWTGGNTFSPGPGNDNASNGGTTSVTSGNVTTTNNTSLCFAGYTDSANGSSLSSWQINSLAAPHTLATTARAETWDRVFGNTFTGGASATSSDNIWVCVLTTFKVEQIGGTQLFSDDFNRANETPLVGNWTRPSGTSPEFNLSGNTVVPGNSTVDTISYRNDVTWPADQYMQAKITASGANAGSGPGVACRMDTVNKTFYWAVIDNAGNINIDRANSGTFANIGTRTVTYAAGGVLKLEVTGTGATVTLKVFYQGSQVGADMTDTSGSRLLSGKGGIAYSSDVGGSIDDAAGGSIP